jgi:hypothetical protein
MVLQTLDSLGPLHGYAVAARLERLRPFQILFASVCRTIQAADAEASLQPRQGLCQRIVNAI